MVSLAARNVELIAADTQVKAMAVKAYHVDGIEVLKIGRDDRRTINAKQSTMT